MVDPRVPFRKKGMKKEAVWFMNQMHFLGEKEKTIIYIRKRSKQHKK